MGNVSSSRRSTTRTTGIHVLTTPPYMGQQQTYMTPMSDPYYNPQGVPPANMYPPYGGPPAPQYNYPFPYNHPPPAPNQQSQPARQTAPTQEYQFTQTIKNQVNLKKSTLKVAPLPGQPSLLAITFTFDSSAACRVMTFVLGTEEPKRNCAITAAQPIAPAIYYDRPAKNLTFPSPEVGPVGEKHVVATGRVSPKDLNSVVGETFPLIIRLEALTDEGRAQGHSLAETDPGEPLPEWVQSQTTYATLNKHDDGSWDVKVLRQKIWVRGQVYDLQEIYGIETGKPVSDPAHRESEGMIDDNDGRECVICLSAERDTTVLPCRHMCMCQGCASALKNQTNKCPICRNEIASLLHIKINKPTQGAGGSGEAGGARGASSSMAQTQAHTLKVS